MKVAEEILGKYLCRQIPGSPTSPGSRTSKICLMITETEAYVGPDDEASHASRGRTKRNEPMFGRAGIWYVYFTYGMYWMLNIVTGPKDYPAAVLIRGIVPNLDGPAKLTKFLKIDGRFNAKSASQKTGLWIEDRGIKIKSFQIRRGPRIGVDYSGKWAKKPYRFLIR